MATDPHYITNNLLCEVIVISKWKKIVDNLSK